MEKPWYKLWPDVYPKSLTHYEGSIGDFMEASARRFPERAAFDLPWENPCASGNSTTNPCDWPPPWPTWE